MKLNFDKIWNINTTYVLMLILCSCAYGYAANGQGVEGYDKVIRPLPDGSLLLHAEYGRAVGPEIQYMPEWQAYGWFDSSSRVEWDVELEESGDYEVYLEWSVSDEEAGKPFAFITDDQKITGEVGRTGSWEDYEIEKIGQVSLSSGRQEMAFLPESEFEEGGALLDLRGVYLVPIK